MSALTKLNDPAFEDIMTAERLRKHWFGENRVPFWNYDPDQIMMGVEIEYFIAHVKGEDFTLATKEEYLSVTEYLVQKFGYKDHQLKDQPGRVSKDTSHGFIAIKPDFAWHILEIALPPRHSLDEIKELLISTFADVDQALAKFGLERLDLSCLPEVPAKMDLVELDRLSGYQNSNSSSNEGHSLRISPALIAATHVHLNCCDEEILSRLPMLYINDEIVRNKFVRFQSFNGKFSQDFRSMFYEDAFGSDYLLRTVPKNIPRSVDDYVEIFNRSSRLFPNDNFYPVRDMSYIRPTRHGTIEFRSTCSFHQIDDLLQIVSLRKSQLLMSVKTLNRKISG